MRPLHIPLRTLRLKKREFNCKVRKGFFYLIFFCLFVKFPVFSSDFKYVGLSFVDVKIGKVSSMIKVFRLRFILAVVAASCSVFTGCGWEQSAPVAQQVEEIRQPIAFLYDHAAGMEIARRERKPTLVFFSVPDNLGSQRMLETTFHDEEIKRLAEWLVCIHVDGLQESALCESLGITNFPTIILSNTNGAEVRRLVGRQTPDQLAVQIHVLLQVMALRPQAVGR